VLYVCASSLAALFLIGFAAFIKSIDKKFRSTFYTTISGAHHVRLEFHNAVTYHDKLSVVKLHRSYFDKLGPEISELLTEKWDMLKKEYWFDRIIARVPEVSAIERGRAASAIS
jgi:hypothetical protein